MKEKVKRFIKGYFIISLIYEGFLVLGIIIGAIIKMANGSSFKDGIREMGESYVSFAQKIAMKMATFYSSLL